MGPCRQEWVTFLGLCLGPKRLLKADVWRRWGLDELEEVTYRRKLTSWKNNALDNNNVCLLSAEGQVTLQILMVSKDHLINSQHKEINHICLAYEMAEKGIK